MPEKQSATHRTSLRPALFLGALGVVYGDIGTSPLYALRECFHGTHAVAPTEANVYGVLSLIVWSLVLVISVKYLLVVMRADNDGEGGILALMALITGAGRKTGRDHDSERSANRRPASSKRVSPHNHTSLVLLGLFGAALLYGDGIITPAISVLSAVEGLKAFSSRCKSGVPSLV